MSANLTRRGFLMLGLPAAAGLIVAPQEIWTPGRKYFLPPKGGWCGPLWERTFIVVGEPEVVRFPWGRIVSIDLGMGHPAMPVDWDAVDWVDLNRRFPDRARWEEEYLLDPPPMSTPKKGIA